MLKLLSKPLPWHLSALDILGIPEFHSHQEDPVLPVITEQKKKLSRIIKEHEKSIESCRWTWRATDQGTLQQMFGVKASKLTGPPSSPGCPWLPWNPELP